ncbi:phosphatidate cytidylyltransferase [Halocynthiibacter namhaensis]|uniref:phosphatidate cytidylyltransferase n=1 Tax=Halocynthiibacter namhaensis TaxID=1290553 RepID=UPI0005794DF7|nr:phosphatidate cytidylyltransferase [Halocynthiibacter namhaensis]
MSKWDDLKPRVISAVVMLVAGIVVTLFGGVPFDILMLMIALIGLRELWMMIRKRLGSPIDVMILFAYGFMITAGCLAFAIVRNDPNGLSEGVFLLAGIVIISDVSGYFAGRLIGGPKFWPRISPKKTWSGTIAGWIGAALFGMFFVIFQYGVDYNFLVWSVMFAVLAFAGQMGDIIQSAIKRRCGVKDSSDLIPGHGGVLDRFDAMIGVGFVVAIFKLIAEG